MSDSGPIDLADLQLKPQWVDELDQPNRFEGFDKGDARPPRGNRSPGGRGGEGRRGDGPRGPREQRGPGRSGDRPQRPPGGGDRRGGDRTGPGRDRRPQQRGGGGGGGDRGRREAPERRGPDRPPLYELLDIDLQPDAAGLEAVAKQIKMTGRSYPVFDLARLVLAGAERYHAQFTLKPETTQVQLVKCTLDGSLWLSKGEALRHFRSTPLFDAYYRKEEVEIEPPKGNFAVVAVCGLSGALLGPPNFHSYQKNIADLHQRRFSRMHIDGYKRKIQMVRDEETIEKWKNTLTKEVHYTYLKSPSPEGASEGESEAQSPIVFKSIGEAERHFSETHGAEVFVSVKEATVAGNITQKHISGALHNMLKRAVERQTRFPMPMVKNISPVLEKAGLRFFKVGRKETFVSRSRPRALSANTEVSPRIRSIVQYIRDNEKQDLNKLVTALVPNASTQEGKEPTPQEIEFLKDLRWLVREGFIIEFSSGELRLGSSRGPLPPVSKNKAPGGQAKPKPDKVQAAPGGKVQPASDGKVQPAPDPAQTASPSSPAAPESSSTASADPGGARRKERATAAISKRRARRRVAWKQADALLLERRGRLRRRFMTTLSNGLAPTRIELRRMRDR